MALFGKNKKEEEKKPVVEKTTKEKTVSKKPTINKSAAKKTVKTAPPLSIVPEKVLLRPRVTEKSAQHTAKNVYTFEISPRATKPMVKAAVKAIYGVSATKIAIVRTPAKKVRLRTRRGYGTKSALKKAYVYLKKGDRIEFAS